jgi:TolA-binding protein
VLFSPRLLLVALLLSAAGAAARAQESLIGEVPFAPAPHVISPAGTSQTRLAAAQAQAIGLPTVAVSLYRAALLAPGADRTSLELALAAALLDEGRPAEAEAALQAAPEHASAAWHVRRGLAQAALRHMDVARSEAAAVLPLDLAQDDWPWYLFLQGTVAVATGQPPAPRPQQLFDEAKRRARSALARARFALAVEEQKLRVGQVSDEALQQARQTAAAFPGQALGYEYARTYAVMLHAAGRNTEAIAALQADLVSVPPSERARQDDFRLLLGLIGGAATPGPGRVALTELLERGGDEDRRRVALQMLASASAQEPNHAEFRGVLDRMIADPANAQSPLMDDLLLYRANLAVDDGADADAQVFAERFLTTYPGSQLRPYVLAVEARAAWNQRRYRSAADWALKARDAYDWADGKALFGVVAAEALFRAGERTGDAGDFRSAADAYAAAIRNPPSGMPPGELMFQRVESEIRAGAMHRAEEAIAELTRSPDFDVANRWRAEYNLVRELRLRNNLPAADQRVTHVLREPLGPGTPPELHGRMLWLQVQLAFDAGKYAESLKLAGQVRAGTGRVPEPLRTQILAQCALLAAQDLFALGRENEAVAALKQLRQDFPKEDAAGESQLVEAAQYAKEDRVAEAVQLLVRLAEDSPQSKYADQALFQAAGLAKNLGQKRNLEEAMQLLERVATTHPSSPLLFEVRMEEGDVLRRYNDLATAERTYQSLVDNAAGNPEIVFAQLALADCDAALGTDPAHAQKAASLYQELLDRTDLQKRADGTDIRVEAGYKLGALFLRRGRVADAQDVWMGQVIHPFLLDPTRAAELGSGRYWMSRAVLELGDLLLAQGKAGEAAAAWRMVLQYGLDGAELAAKRIQQLTPAAPR